MNQRTSQLKAKSNKGFLDPEWFIFVRSKIGREIEQEQFFFEVLLYMSKKAKRGLRRKCRLLLSHFLHPIKGVIGTQTSSRSLIEMSEGIYISLTWYILH